jgi:hypothetical protein
MNKSILIIILTALSTTVAFPSHATAQSILEIARARAPKFMRTSYHPKREVSANAEVTNPRFAKVEGNRGLWTGFVKGHGDIHLSLRIVRNGTIEAVRHIGSVTQRRWEKPCPFFFKSSLPRGSNWSWLIVATPG